MDIVERLRKRVIPVRYGEFTDELEDKDCQEAADEIERLLQVLKTIQKYALERDDHDFVHGIAYLAIQPKDK